MKTFLLKVLLNLFFIPLTTWSFNPHWTFKTIQSIQTWWSTGPWHKITWEESWVVSSVLKNIFSLYLGTASIYFYLQNVFFLSPCLFKYVGEKHSLENTAFIIHIDQWILLGSNIRKLLRPKSVGVTLKLASFLCISSNETMDLVIVPGGPDGPGGPGGPRPPWSPGVPGIPGWPDGPWCPGKPAEAQNKAQKFKWF